MRSWPGKVVGGVGRSAGRALERQIRVVRFAEQQTLAWIELQRATVTTAADALVGLHRLWLDRIDHAGAGR